MCLHLPHKDFRLYPGIPRDTEHWDNLYRTRVTAHRTINLLKDTFQTAHRKTFNTLSLKADIFLSGIVQLVGVLLAYALHKADLIKSIRKLIANKLLLYFLLKRLPVVSVVMLFFNLAVKNSDFRPPFVFTADFYNCLYAHNNT